MKVLGPRTVLPFTPVAAGSRSDSPRADSAGGRAVVRTSKATGAEGGGEEALIPV